MKTVLAAGTGLLLVAAAAQAAPAMKAGLWNVTATTKMANMPKLPPQVMAMMKARGMPGIGQPVTTQVCMTGKEKADAAMAARLSRGQTKCTPHVVSQTARSMTTDITCTGTMQGTGHSTMTWQGNTQYVGDYSFKGTMGGMPQDMQTHYVGAWVKADCGAVKPLAGR